MRWRSSRQLSSSIDLCTRRRFHDYFVTHIPSSSQHPDTRTASPNDHQLPRADSLPHASHDHPVVPTQLISHTPHNAATTRNTTVVRIPLRSARHHFGATTARGARPYNEDRYQAGTVEIPAFAKRQPRSLTRKDIDLRDNTESETPGAETATGDPQVFYFGVFDGHGGDVCSEFLKESLHSYVEEACRRFHVTSSLRRDTAGSQLERSTAVRQADDRRQLQFGLVAAWKQVVGGYFNRFRPEHFFAVNQKDISESEDPAAPNTRVLRQLSTALTYAFLKADLDFVQEQARKHASSTAADDPVLDDRPLNDDDILAAPSRPRPQTLFVNDTLKPRSETRFLGGSTASIALVSTPSPMPFWHPATPSTLVVSHVGDTRILLCRVSDGQAVHLTSNHHPSTPIEATRLRRFSATFITDSFGEERIEGLANTRAFGDISSKAVGVSAEPEITSVQLAPSEYSCLVIMSDGISGVLADQEIVDIIKEAKTPEQASIDVVEFATEISHEADNATCMVVRLGGWARRGEGGTGSLGTKEMRDYKRREAENPRARRS